MARLAFILILLFPLTAFAVEPEEMLSDPQLEARARALDEEIRCVQCQSENIASSNADWAKDARLILRELISDGASDEEVITFFVERYGERVLMRPRADGVNWLLWFAGPGMLILAVLIAGLYLRKRNRISVVEPLSSEENKRLHDILNG